MEWLYGVRSMDSMNSHFKFFLFSLVFFLSTGCVYRPIFSVDDLFSFSFNETTQVVESQDQPRAMWAANWVGAQRPMPLPAPQLVVNPAVERELKWFHAKHRTFLPLSLERREPYYDTVAQIFQDEGLPLELMHIALIESGFRTKVKSNAGARGIWQFTKGTARAYGLHVGMWSDERTDPILSTIAAARHLRDLYARYEDWYLALAAYNAGTGAVNRAIKRTGSKDFWVLSDKRKLPYQTRRYVPRFIATTLILQDPKKYGFDDRTVQLARATQPNRLESLG